MLESKSLYSFQEIIHENIYSQILLEHKIIQNEKVLENKPFIEEILKDQNENTNVINIKTLFDSIKNKNQEKTNKIKKMKEDTIISKTQGDINDFKAKWKTERCHYWEMDGKCKFGEKCAFAHGDKDLNNRIKPNKYKTKQCKQFFEFGYCPYGTRCQFSHQIILKDINKALKEKTFIYTDIFSNLISKGEVSIRVIKRPRLKVFEKITNCSLKEIEQNRINLYKDILMIKKQIILHENKENNILPKFTSPFFKNTFITM